MLIDELRKLGTTPRILAKGAVELPISETQSYHFYSEETPQTIDDIHNHRHSFTSLLVKGDLRNYIYDLEDDNNSTQQLVRGPCFRVCHASKKLCCKVKVERENFRPVEICRFDTIEGNNYRIKYDLFHEIEKLTPTVITLITNETQMQDTAQFVIDLDDPTECDLRTPATENECWEIIHDTLILQ